MKKSKTVAEKEYMSKVVNAGCIVCRNAFLGETPAELHHVRFLAGAGQRASNYDIIPLCPIHHRLGGYGIAFHAGPEIWQEKFGDERELLSQTKLENNYEH
jgi:hypothetical protein